MPDDQYLRKVGLVAYLVSSLEGLLLFDLPRLQAAVPPQLAVDRLAGKTTKRLGEQLVEFAPACATHNVAAYLGAGGRALVEVAPKRNALLHARPATDEQGRTRLYRWRLPEAHFIDDVWLDRVVQRIDDLHTEVNGLRPQLPD